MEVGGLETVLFGGFLVVTVWVSHSCSKELSSVLGGVNFDFVMSCCSLALNRRVSPDFLVRRCGALAQLRLVCEYFDCQPSSSSTARVEIRLLVVSLAEACS
ncbi:hypothetical protein DY000_02036788 [Brassica cretica]|uniref:Secreted protein n=1 Tax=Brassica cretica TaxID=69181 RepID=A0ABQ7BGT0_BRACR|nr:hypothetical protein DY000_02036788 [Brassica cretica]